MSSVSPRQVQQGATFIEILVTLVIMSMGLFRAGLMTSRSVHMADESMLHTQAVQLAQVMIDRTRVNNSGLATYATTYADEPSAASSCLAVTCSPSNLALADLVDWKDKLSASLPQGLGQVEVNGTTVLVSVRWNIRGVEVTYQLQAIDA